jgi:hypothetical protein
MISINFSCFHLNFHGKQHEVEASSWKVFYSLTINQHIRLLMEENIWLNVQNVEPMSVLQGNHGRWLDDQTELAKGCS